MSSFDAFWEHDEALNDLLRNVLRAIILPFPVLQYLWHEVRVYRRYLNGVVETNNALRIIGQVLAEAQSATVGRVSVLEGVAPYVDKITELDGTFASFAASYWQRVYVLDKPKPREGESSVYPPSHDPGLRLLSNGLTVPRLTQERNLDTTFQVRVGDLLRSQVGWKYRGKRLKLSTISRLVLLVYICADLANDDGSGHLVICESDPKRKLKVENTYDTLRNAGLR